MTEAERLGKIVQTQEKELRRLRKLLAIARIAQAEFAVQDGKLNVIVTAISVDEYYFIEQCKPELQKIAEAILAQRGVEFEAKEITDTVTGLPAEGGVVPEP